MAESCAEIATRCRARLARAQAAVNRLAAGDLTAEAEAAAECSALQTESVSIGAHLSALESEHGAAVAEAQRILDDATARGLEELPALDLAAFQACEARMQSAGAKVAEVVQLAAHLREVTEHYAARFAATKIASC
ncbi:MAG: hypothetical protein HS116_05185 [Planctomycetes bacterium]|nr:hypothetical protein [Planctomycetota bacterium]